MSNHRAYNSKSQGAQNQDRARLQLSVIQDGKRLQESPFVGPEIAIGSLPQSDLRLGDPFVSGIHCLLTIQDNRVILTDKNSKNGTMLNGRRVQQLEIMDGDTFQVGRSLIVVHFINGFGANQATEVAVEHDEKTAIDMDVRREPAARKQQQQRQQQHAAAAEAPVVAAYDPNHFDLMEEDPYDRNFQPAFSLVKTMVRAPKGDAVRRGGRVLEIIEFDGDSIYASNTFGAGAVHQVRTEMGKRRIVKAGAAGYTLYFHEDDEGFVVLSGQKTELKDFANDGRAVSRKRNGLCVAELGDEDEACVRIEGRKYYLRFSDRQHVPAARFDLIKSGRELGKMIGLSCLTHVLAIIIFAFISTRGNAALEPEEERFVKISVEDLAPKQPPEPPKKELVAEKPTPKPTPVVKKPEPKPEPKVVKKIEPPKPVVAKKMPVPVQKQQPKPTLIVEKPKVKVQAPGEVVAVPQINVAKTGVLGALAGIGNPNKQPMLASALTNLSAVQARGGVQTFSVSGLQGKTGSDDVVIMRIGDVNTKGASGVGHRNYGMAAVSNRKGSGGGIAGMVSGEDAIIRPKVKGSLSYEEIMKVIQAHLGEIHTCYEKALMDDPGLAGKLNVFWTISSEGSVNGTRIQGSELRNGQVHACVSSNVRSWIFPKPRGGGVVDVSFPFVFNNTGV